MIFKVSTLCIRFAGSHQQNTFSKSSLELKCLFICDSMNILYFPEQMQPHSSSTTKNLTKEEQRRLHEQNSRLVSDHKARLLEIGAQKHWDLFYKRNETRFFKDRHWTTREFEELLNDLSPNKTTLFEIGCGVGNFIFPLVEKKLNFKIIACDLSPRAIEIVQANPNYDPDCMKAFQCDITTDEVFDKVETASVDIATLIFVLSAIHPDKFVSTLKTIFELLKPGGMMLFRDYGLYDMAQLRFKAGHKIAENFYMRQDGTRSYYFSTEFIEGIFKQAGFDVLVNTYVHRRTVNKKESIDVPRIFVQVLQPRIWDVSLSSTCYQVCCKAGEFLQFWKIWYGEKYLMMMTVVGAVIEEIVICIIQRSSN
ncbi:hypothetical protein NQ315_003052 [Exocentrus adspersus]|uniref:tRNA N(3)-cytidine methyltransferase METTL6 n=1 Tax=Exocentrus adspersus TaxID=1586481 RepID=A0AAV8W514_9CUCU|nr:hypothetical protein NQ315_003052 [Exocentrus adspersus]